MLLTLRKSFTAKAKLTIPAMAIKIKVEGSALLRADSMYRGKPIRLCAKTNLKLLMISATKKLSAVILSAIAKDRKDPPKTGRALLTNQIAYTRLIILFFSISVCMFKLLGNEPYGLKLMPALYPLKPCVHGKVSSSKPPR